MGWVAIYKDGKIVREEHGAGRPVADGQKGKLRVIAQEDYHHSVAVDLVNGIIAFDYGSPINVQNGTVEIDNPKLFLFIMEGASNIVGDLKHRRSRFDPKLDPETKEPMFRDGEPVVTRTDIETGLVWRPIWFTRHSIPGGDFKVIGAQTTLPKGYGGKNVKKIVTLFPDGRLGID